MVDHIYDFDNQFFRQISIALAKTLTKSIRWINYYEPKDENDTGRIRVVLPFYTSLTGDERFVLDAFVDDVVDKRVSMNTDQYQRGVITFTNFSSKSGEFANPNQYLSQQVNINGDLRKIISKVKAVPVTVNFDIEIQLATTKEINLCSQKIMDLLFNYMFFNIDYYGMKIDAVLKLPDDKAIEIPREVGMDTDKRKTIKFSLDVSSYYPIFAIEADDLITCDNDGDFNWDYMGVPRPINDFTDALKKYNESFGNTTKIIYEDGTSSTEGVGEIKRVYWKDYYHELARAEQVQKERPINPNNWLKEDFHISPVQPGKSKPDNDI